MEEDVSTDWWLQNMNDTFFQIFWRITYLPLFLRQVQLLKLLLWSMSVMTTSILIKVLRDVTVQLLSLSWWSPLCRKMPALSQGPLWVHLSMYLFHPLKIFKPKRMTNYIFLEFLLIIVSKFEENYFPSWKSYIAWLQTMHLVKITMTSS